MRIATKWAAILTSPLMLSACGSGPGWLGSKDLTSGEPRISDAVWFQTQNVHVNPQGSEVGSKAYFEDDQYLPVMCLTPASRRLEQGKYVYVSQNPDLAPCIAQMKILIDRRFEHWIDSFNAWNSGGNAIIDNVVIGAGIAGTAAGGLTSRVMNAISASLTGVKTTVNNDFFIKNRSR